MSTERFLSVIQDPAENVFQAEGYTFYHKTSEDRFYYKGSDGIERPFPKPTGTSGNLTKIDSGIYFLFNNANNDEAQAGFISKPYGSIELSDLPDNSIVFHVATTGNISLSNSSSNKKITIYNIEASNFGIISLSIHSSAGSSTEINFISQSRITKPDNLSEGGSWDFFLSFSGSGTTAFNIHNTSIGSVSADGIEGSHIVNIYDSFIEDRRNHRRPIVINANTSGSVGLSIKNSTITYMPDYPVQGFSCINLGNWNVDFSAENCVFNTRNAGLIVDSFFSRKSSRIKNCTINCEITNETFKRIIEVYFMGISFISNTFNIEIGSGVDPNDIIVFNGGQFSNIQRNMVGGFVFNKVFVNSKGGNPVYDIFSGSFNANNAIQNGKKICFIGNIITSSQAKTQPSDSFDLNIQANRFASAFNVIQRNEIY